MIDKRNFFVFEIVKAMVAERPAHSKALHYIAGGTFVTAGKVVRRENLFIKVS